MWLLLIVLSYPYQGIVKQSLIWPVPSKRITSEFGSRRHPVTRRWTPHNGIDVRASTGTPVRATTSGTVKFAGWKSRGMGYAVIIDHGDGFTSTYGHLSKAKAKKGKWVEKGEVIAYSGSSGRLSTGPHLYFEIRKNGKAQNPIRYLGGEVQIASPQKMLVTLEKGFETIVEIWGEKKVDWENTRTLLVMAEKIEITRSPYQEGKFKVGIIRH